MSSTPAPLEQQSSRFDIALLILRSGCALVFFYHGSAILFGAFGGPGPENLAHFLHIPVFMGYLVGLAQVAGALALLTGILFRVGAVCILAVMAGAILVVHLHFGFDVSKNGMEFALTEFLIALSLLFTGPGSYSLGKFLPPSLRRL